MVGVPLELLIVGTTGPLVLNPVELVKVIPVVVVVSVIAAAYVVVTFVYFPGIIEIRAAPQIVAPKIPSMFAIFAKATTGLPATGPSSPTVSGVPVPGEVVGGPLTLPVVP